MRKFSESFFIHTEHHHYKDALRNAFHPVPISLDKVFCWVFSCHFVSVENLFHNSHCFQTYIS